MLMDNPRQNRAGPGWPTTRVEGGLGVPGTRAARLSGLLTAALVPLAYTGCLTSPDADVSEIEIVSGNDQFQGRERQLNDPVMVRAVDDGGHPVAGATIEFAPAPGNGSVSHYTVETDSIGEAVVRWTLGDEASAHSMTASVRDGPNATIRATARVSDFDIHVVVEEGFTAEQVTAIRAASERWTDVIVGDKPDLVIPEDYQVPSHCEGIETLSPGTIDDFRVNVRPGRGTLAICEFIPSPVGRKPAWVYLGIDESFVREFGVDLQDWITYQLGHALGFGLYWGSLKRNSVRDEGPGADTHFVDSATIAAFDAAGGVDWTGGSKVPVENEAIGADYLWRRTVFGNEIMVGPPWGPNPPLSAITVQSMAALGYEVDVTRADPFILRVAGARSGWDVQAPGTGGRSLHGRAELIYDRGHIVGIVYR